LEKECKEKMVERIRNFLKLFKESDIIHFEHTKNVTPTKKLYRITFKLSVEDALYDDVESNLD